MNPRRLFFRALMASAVLAFVGCSRSLERSGKVADDAEPTKPVSESAGPTPEAASRGEAIESAEKPPELPKPEPPAEAERPRRRPRVLWRAETTGGRDYFAQLVPAGEVLLAVRAGVLYAFDVETGEVRWRFPEGGVMEKVKRYAHASFVLGVLGDKVITRLPGNLAGGVQELRLADGTILRTLDTKADIGFPTPEFRYPRGASRVFSGTQITFSSDLPKQLGTQVCVFDLEKWREVGRFRIAPVHGEVLAVDGRVIGFFRHEKEEKFARAFSVDLARGEIFSLPLRTSRLVPETTVLPDGSRLVREGRLSPKCAYDGFWPWMSAAQVHAVDERVFVFDPYGFARVNPRDRRELWRLPLSPAKWHAQAMVAGGEDVLAVGVGNYVYLIDAEKGAMIAAMRVLDGFKTFEERRRGRYWMRLACDGKRAYFSWAKGLVAFSTRPVQKDRPDPGDPADPASAIARSREAASKGDFETALKAIHESSVSVLLRPECREEFAALFSQLSRSPAAETLPGLWTDVLLADGWVCGELFLQKYGKLLDQHATKGQATPALHAMGGQAALALLDKRLKTKHPFFFMPYAARARWKLTGKRPLGELLARKDDAVVVVGREQLDEPLAKEIPTRADRARSLSGSDASAMTTGHWCRR